MKNQQKPVIKYRKVWEVIIEIGDETFSATGMTNAIATQKARAKVTAKYPFLSFRK